MTLINELINGHIVLAGETMFELVKVKIICYAIGLKSVGAS
ncbi:MAG TPA: hypothetical protein ACHBY4_03355 [Arsenophonus apicola]